MKKTVPVDARFVPKEAKRVFRGVIYDVYHWEQVLFDGSTATFEMLKRPDTIEVLAVKDNKLIVLKEEQPDSPEPYYAVPGGRHDVPGETGLEAAKRELLEETGMKFATWKLLLVRQTAAKVEYFIYMYLATDFIEQGEPHLDAGEKIEVMELSLGEAKKLAKTAGRNYLPKQLLRRLSSFDELVAAPAYQGVEVEV